MKLWNKIKTARLMVKILLSSAAVLLTLTILFLPILTVDAGETAARTAEHPGLANMARQDATFGIVLLSSVLVLIVVGGTLRVISQDRRHRPHLIKQNGQGTAEEKQEPQE